VVKFLLTGFQPWQCAWRQHLAKRRVRKMREELRKMRREAALVLTTIANAMVSLF
jgi:hypothetical protein